MNRHFLNRLTNPDLGGIHSRESVVVMDSVLTALPADTRNPMVADGVTLALGERVLFTNLADSNKNNRVYAVKVSALGLHTMQLQTDGLNVNGAPHPGESIQVEDGTHSDIVLGFENGAWDNVEFNSLLANAGVPPAAPLPVLTSDPASPIIGDQWLLYTPPVEVTSITGTIANSDLLGASSTVSGSLAFSMTGLDAADRVLFTSLGIFGAASSALGIGFQTIEIAISGTGGAVTTSLNLFGNTKFTVAVAGGTIQDMVNSLNAWGVSNLHSGIGNIFTLSTPGDGAQALDGPGVGNTTLMPGGNAVLDSIQLSVQISSGPKRVALN